jgi:hypothetical protein
MVELADQRKELLGKYGLVEEMLQSARQSVDKLDEVSEAGCERRRIHVSPTLDSRQSCSSYVLL